VNRNGILATKTVWHEILLKHMFLHTTGLLRRQRSKKKLKKAKKSLKAKPKVQNPKFQNFIIFSADVDHME
jgi:hypothetical protein